eukprot:scaffold72600_cov75-Phaeocystis_antarctica.AAC.2
MSREERKSCPKSTLKQFEFHHASAFTRRKDVAPRVYFNTLLHPTSGRPASVPASCWRQYIVTKEFSAVLAPDDTHNRCLGTPTRPAASQISLEITLTGSTWREYYGKSVQFPTALTHEGRWVTLAGLVPSVPRRTYSRFDPKKCVSLGASSPPCRRPRESPKAIRR